MNLSRKIENMYACMGTDAVMFWWGTRDLSTVIRSPLITDTLGKVTDLVRKQFSKPLKQWTAL